jgi:hypothetical protein
VVRKIFLRQRVLPAIIFYVLLPRSVFYLSRTFAIISVISFSVILIVYMLFRYKIVIEKVDNKSLIVLDSMFVLAGVILACIFNYNTSLASLFCVTTIPLFVNNHKVMKKIE